MTNQANKSYIQPTLLGTLHFSAVGGLLDLLLKALKLLTFGQVNLDLNLQGLLTPAQRQSFQSRHGCVRRPYLRRCQGHGL